MTTSYQKMTALFDAFEAKSGLDENRLRKRNRILAEATQLFIHHGYRKTSMDDVARASGVAKGTLYLYFKTKGEVLLHAIVVEKRRYFEELRPLFNEDVEPLHRLREWLKICLRIGHEMPLISKIISGDREVMDVIRDFTSDAIEQRQIIETDIVAKMIDEAMPGRFSPQALAGHAKLICANIFAMAMLPNEMKFDLTNDELAELHANNLVNGLLYHSVKEQKE